MTRKFFFDSCGNEVPAFDSIAELKNHIFQHYDMEAVKDEGLMLHSGVLDGHRYYGEGGEGSHVDEIEALDNFGFWWNEDWDEEVSEM